MNLNAFSIELYKKLAASPGNQLLCPFSVYSALFLLYAGARGETERQLGQVLCDSSEMPERLERFRVFLDDLHIFDTDSGFDSSNRLWVQQGYALNQDYLKDISRLDKECLQQVDFSKGEETAKTINGWAKKATRGKIEKFISEKVLSPKKPLLVTNASYFKCDWKEQFLVSKTMKKPFRSFDSASNMEIKHVPMMGQTDSFKYYADEQLQAVELLYSSENVTRGPLSKELKQYLTFGGPNPLVYAFSMVILLPGKDNGIFELEQKLTSEYISNCINLMRSHRTSVSLPRFRLKGKYPLKEVLVTAGMTDTFNSAKADFSGITQEGGLFVSDLYQENCIDVEETGTEAAAVTGMLMMGTFKEGIKEFNADHPFLYLIRHISSGAIIFMGRVLNPESSTCR